jgi:hypothetical protein
MNKVTYPYLTFYGIHALLRKLLFSLNVVLIEVKICLLFQHRVQVLLSTKKTVKKHFALKPASHFAGIN